VGSGSLPKEPGCWRRGSHQRSCSPTAQGAFSPGLFFPQLFGRPGSSLSPCLPPAHRKGLQLSGAERFSLLCSVRCIFHTLSFPAGRGLETLRAVGYCLSPALFVCLLVGRFFGLLFLLDFLFFFFPFSKLLARTKAKPQSLTIGVYQ